jgi:hypothetical protein
MPQLAVHHTLLRTMQSKVPMYIPKPLRRLGNNVPVSGCTTHDICLFIRHGTVVFHSNPPLAAVVSPPAMTGTTVTTTC